MLVVQASTHFLRYANDLWRSPNIYDIAQVSTRILGRRTAPFTTFAYS